jgi:DNA-binding response OmpR family regulator
MAEHQKLRVLVIDDEVTQRMLVKEYLEEAGHSVRLSEDGKRGFKMATATNPDIILLDLMLPSIDGYSLCKSFKSTPATADTPVILITASREADVIEKGLAAGADDFLTKPVDWAFLSDRVLNVVSKAKERAEMARQIRAAQAASQAPAAAVLAPEIDAQLEELTRNAEVQLEQAHEAGRTERARLEAEHVDAMDRAVEDLRAEFQAEFDTEIASRDTLHAEAIAHAVKQARLEFAAELSGRDSQHAEAVNNTAKNVRAALEAQIATLKALHSEELHSVRERCALDIETVRNSAQHDQLVLERRSNSEINALRAALETSNARSTERTGTAGDSVAKVQAAWSLALRSTTAQSVLASAIAAKSSAAAAALGGNAELTDLDRTARSLNNLHASFKLLAQAMASPAVPKETPVDLNSLAAGITAQAGRIAHDRRVEVRCASIAPGTFLMSDEGRLRYAWTSLVINAIRFTPVGGSVELMVTSDEDNSLRLSVSDTGVGIAPAKLRELQTCLDEASPDQSARPGETAGLGIPVATALARQMGGRVEIGSQLGGGTQASLVFPAAKRGEIQFNQTAKAG